MSCYFALVDRITKLAERYHAKEKGETMAWTTQEPSKPGLYWWRRDRHDTDPWIVKVQKLDTGLMGIFRIGHRAVTIMQSGGKWQGPLAPEEAG